MPDPPSLVLVTVDCLRSDHVGWMGYSRPTTPFLDSLAAESFVFSSAIVAGAPTFYSFPSILASRYPLALGRDVVGLAPGETNLASVLRQAGYRTAAFSAGNPYLSAHYGYDQGFDHFQDFVHSDRHNGNRDQSKHPGPTPWNERLARLARRIGLGPLYDDLYFQYIQRLRNRGAVSYDQLRCFPAADALVSQAKDWLASIQGPFFLWLHFMDPHGPYYPAEPALRAMGDEDLSPGRARYLNQYWSRRELKAQRLRRYHDSIVRLYDAGIRWVDTELSFFIEALKSTGAWNNCVLAFTADHGEEFLEHGSRFHPQWTAKEELIRVPLLIRTPDRQSANVSSVFSHVDLAPTLLDAMGLAIPADFQGRSRWGYLQSGSGWYDPAIMDCTEVINPHGLADRCKPRVLCVRDQRYKLIVRFASQSDELYDLLAEPSETKPVASTAERAVRQRLLQVAREHLARPKPSHGFDLRLRCKLHDLRTEISSLGRT
jgi:arylsulfatase A-like enzyme